MNSPTGTREEPRRPGKRPAPRGTAFYPRKRANTACQVCRARKTKCDNLKPSCTYCLSVGAVCIQSPVDLSAFDPASLKILERLDELERLMKESREQTSARQLSEDNRQATPRQSSSADIPLRSILPEKVESLLLWSTLTDQCAEPGEYGLRNEPPHTFTPDTGSIGSLMDLEPQGLNTLLDNFFMYVHCKNPIFDEASTRRLVSKVILDGVDWSPESCLALLVCALGRLATPFGPSLDTKPDTAAYTEARSFFNAAQRRIGILLSRADIIGGQCLFLSGVYMICTFQPFQAWRFFSQALASCQTLPFLRKAHTIVESVAQSPSDFMVMNADDTQQQAVYWSAWKSEREMRGDLVLPDFNMPHSTSVLYPPFFPTPPYPIDTAKPKDTERQRTSWLFYLAEISLRRLSSRICSEILQLHRDSDGNTAFLAELSRQVPDYETQAHQWADNLPPELSITGPPETDNVCVYVLRGHFVNFFETIYWPFVMAHISCLEGKGVAMPYVQEFASKGLYYHVRRVHVNEPGFLHRHHGTWPMIRGSFRSILVLLAAVLCGSEMPDGWLDATHQVISLLGNWEDEAQDFSNWKRFAQRIVACFDDQG